MQTILRSVFISALFLFYPYLVYLGIKQGIVWFAPTLIASVYLYQAIQAKNKKIKQQKWAIVCALLLGTIFFQEVIAKFMPIFIQLSLMLFFGKTLFKGPPLIERFVRFEFPDIPPVIQQYCRHLTIMWTSFFAFNIIACIVLALFAPIEWWAIYTGVMIFMLSGLLMVAEYIWRHFYFRRIDLPHKEIPSVRDSIKNMIINGKTIWFDVQES